MYLGQWLYLTLGSERDFYTNISEIKDNDSLFSSLFCDEFKSLMGNRNPAYDGQSVACMYSAEGSMMNQIILSVLNRSFLEYFSLLFQFEKIIILVPLRAFVCYNYYYKKWAMLICKSKRKIINWYIFWMVLSFPCL